MPLRRLRGWGDGPPGFARSAIGLSAAEARGLARALFLERRGLALRRLYDLERILARDDPRARALADSDADLARAGAERARMERELDDAAGRYAVTVTLRRGHPAGGPRPARWFETVRLSGAELLSWKADTLRSLSGLETFLATARENQPERLAGYEAWRAAIIETEADLLARDHGVRFEPRPDAAATALPPLRIGFTLRVANERGEGAHLAYAASMGGGRARRETLDCTDPDTGRTRHHGGTGREALAGFLRGGVEREEPS